MKTKIFVFAVVCGVLTASTSHGQEAPDFPGPEKEHALLHKFVGEWETESEATLGLGQPPMKFQGVISGRMVGGLWAVSEMQGEAMGLAMTSVQTIGYDAAKKKYIGTWVDSMVNYMWRYEGSVDETGKILTLEAEGPNYMTGGKITKFRDAFEFKSADHIINTSSMLDEDGEWVTFMTGHTKRKE